MKFSVTVQEKADLLIQVTVSGISTCYITIIVRVKVHFYVNIYHVENISWYLWNRKKSKNKFTGVTVV
jgi:hypothetical protein